MKIIYPDYSKSLVNLMNSIRAYFGLEKYHESLNYIDELLNNKQYKNVVVMLFDGMGSKILDKHLDKESFLQTHKIKDILSTFPSTTSAATLTVRTGKTPIENGWIGWHIYLDDLDDDIVMFTGDQYYGDKSYGREEALKHFPITSIADELNNKGIKAEEIYPPFGQTNKCKTLNEFFKKTKYFLKNHNEKQYIYAYWDEPDHSMHDLGNDKNYITKIIKKIESHLKSLVKNLDEDTIIFVIADHGHINVEHIDLLDHPDLLKLLKRLPSIESRNATFFIKEGKEQEFIDYYNKNFKDYFELFTKNEVSEKQLFGNGKEAKNVSKLLGDFLLSATSNKMFIYGETQANMKSAHAGITEDEMLVPLIVLTKEK